MESLTSTLLALQDLVLTAVRESIASSSVANMSRTVRDDQGDTIFGIDLAAEEVLLPFCEELGRSMDFLLMAEGIEPEGRVFGSRAPQYRLIVDPIDGTRGLMHDKRSAWSLAAFATEHGADTRMEHVIAAAMTELPNSRQGFIDRMWGDKTNGAHGERLSLFDGSKRDLPLVPSQRTDLHHGFATICDFFPGGKELIAKIAEGILHREMGGWNPEKAEIFSDQYIASGGQLAELILGRDRFVMDIRPLVYNKLGVQSSLCARPYDLCTMLLAELVGVVIEAPEGGPCNPPLDVTTNVAFAAYANPNLAARLQPIVHEVLATL